jgi:hypothetical protein
VISDKKKAESLVLVPAKQLALDLIKPAGDDDLRELALALSALVGQFIDQRSIDALLLPPARALASFTPSGTSYQRIAQARPPLILNTHLSNDSDSSKLLVKCVDVLVNNINADGLLWVREETEKELLAVIGRLDGEWTWTICALLLGNAANAEEYDASKPLISESSMSVIVEKATTPQLLKMIRFPLCNRRTRALILEQLGKRTGSKRDFQGDPWGLWDEPDYRRILEQSLVRPATGQSPERKDGEPEGK